MRNLHRAKAATRLLRIGFSKAGWDLLILWVSRSLCPLTATTKVFENEGISELNHIYSDEPPESTNSHIPLRFWPSTLLALASGALYFAAFPGVDVWPLGFAALVPLIIALRGQSPRRGFWLGWVSGFTMTMTGFYWLLEMLRVFSGFSTVLCVLFMALLCAYQAGRMALAGFLSARTERRNWPFGLAFSLAFAASELVFPLLFPWYFGATLHSQPWMLQLAEIGGPIAVGLVLVTFNLAISEPIAARLEGRKPRWRRVLTLASISGFAAIYGIIRVRSVHIVVQSAPKARVGIVQANMSLYGKRHELEEGLQRHLALTQQLRQKGKLDFVVWSETSVMRPVDENARCHGGAARLFQKFGCFGTGWLSFSPAS